MVLLYLLIFVNLYVWLDRELETCRVDRRSFLTGIDVNRVPVTTVDMEEETGMSSPNSTISSLSGNKRSLVNERSELATGDEILECSRSDDEDGDNSRKKLRLTKDQSAILEESFKEHNTLNPVSMFCCYSFCMKHISI